LSAKTIALSSRALGLAHRLSSKPAHCYAAGSTSSGDARVYGLAWTLPRALSADPAKPAKAKRPITGHAGIFDFEDADAGTGSRSSPGYAVLKDPIRCLASG
jgi:hypothetical protein